MPMMYDYGYGHGWGSFGAFWMIVFWAALIWFIVWLVRRSDWHSMRGTESLEIVRQRYAKGDITKKQFDEMKKDLNG
ncbi:MAG: SHOCT domain-containing protein [Candidatus Woesearchaeota archaeon]